MRNSIKAYAYALADGWYFSKSKLDDCSAPLEKIKITFLPDTPPETKKQLRRSLRSGLMVQRVSEDEV